MTDKYQQHHKLNKLFDQYGGGGVPFSKLREKKRTRKRSSRRRNPPSRTHRRKRTRRSKRRTRKRSSRKYNRRGKSQKKPLTTIYENMPLSQPLPPPQSVQEKMQKLIDLHQGDMDAVKHTLLIGEEEDHTKYMHAHGYVDVQINPNIVDRAKTPKKHSKKHSKKHHKKHHKKHSKKHSKKHKNNCKCGSHQYSSKEDTPRGLGHCEECIPLNVVLKGKDGNYYRNEKKGWVKI